MDEDDDLDTLSEIAEDLERTREFEEEELDIKLPEAEPGVPCFYRDGQTEGEVGYVTTPQKTRVVALCRRQYTAERAFAWFATLQERHRWRVVGEPFWTARHYCWRIEVK
jgi:hypothetical protein